MAEVLLRARRPTLEVQSAGRLPGGVPASPTAVQVVAERGLDLSKHLSQTTTPELVGESDLILGMAREHVRNAVLLRPEVRSRAFTLKDLVRRGEASRRRAAGQPLDDWLNLVGADRTTNEMLGESPADDVADPIGQSISRYRACADELDDMLARLADLAFPGVP